MMNHDESYETDPAPDNTGQELTHENQDAAELEEMRAALNECQTQLIRSRADMDNQCKRMQREIETAKVLAAIDFIAKLLPAKDSLEKGLKIADEQDGIEWTSLYEGMTSTLKICNEAFKAEGIEEINPLGEEFDPEVHEAMTVKKSEDTEPNRVLSVYQKGYVLKRRLIRPARVEVSGS
jgi:molecular chaperone GrpE